MQIEFDPAKDVINREKHGVSLAFGEEVFGDGRALLISSARPIDGEERWKVVGLVGDRLWTAVHVVRGDAIRMISVRRSNGQESRGYGRDPR